MNCIQDLRTKLKNNNTMKISCAKHCWLPRLLEKVKQEPEVVEDSRTLHKKQSRFVIRSLEASYEKATNVNRLKHHQAKG